MGSAPQPYRSASAIASRQRRRVVANGRIFDANPSCARQADFEVRPADSPGQGGALPQVTFSVGQPQRPRLDDSQIHQRHRAQVAAERDVLVGLAGYRGGKEFGLFDERRQR